MWDPSPAELEQEFDEWFTKAGMAPNLPPERLEAESSRSPRYSAKIWVWQLLSDDVVAQLLAAGEAKVVARRVIDRLEGILRAAYSRGVTRGLSAATAEDGVKSGISRSMVEESFMKWWLGR